MTPSKSYRESFGELAGNIGSFLRSPFFWVMVLIGIRAMTSGSKRR